MPRRKLTRRQTAWLTLVAMLFSALSPAMASVLFAHRPDVMARVLALPAQWSSVVAGDICHSPNAQSAVLSSTAPQSEEPSDHAVHGILCAFCLNASAGFALLAPAEAGAMAITAPAEILLARRSSLPTRPPVSNHRSRAPPVLS